MKKEIACALLGLFISPLCFAVAPVTLLGPIPQLPSTLSAGSSQTFIYTITNKVPKVLPISVEGLSGLIKRTPVLNDCGDHLPGAGVHPATCNIGITISPTQANIGVSVNQTLQFNYQGRKPLEAQISFVTRPSMLYVSNISPSSASQCVVNLETGVISQCRLFLDPSFNVPTDVTINPTGTHAYFANINSGSISECPIKADGSLSRCTVFLNNGTLTNVAGLAVNRMGTILYTANFSSNTLAICTLNYAGRISNCISSVPGPLNNPDDIVVDPSNRFLYITNNGSNTVLRCQIGINGNLHACIQSNPVFFGPTGIAINASGTRLYVNNLNSTVGVCPILPGPQFLGPCTFENPDGNFNIFFGKNTTYRNSLLFVANGGGGNTISVCRLNSQGNLVTCPAQDPNSTFGGPQGVALN